MANDVRWLGSGPRCGHRRDPPARSAAGQLDHAGQGEPGHVGDAADGVRAGRSGNDATIGWGGAAGNFELNVMMPVMAYNFLQSVAILANGCRLFAARCIEGIEPDEKRCTELVEQSLAMVTALTPRIGYDAAAAIAKESVKTGKTVRELCLEKKCSLPTSWRDYSMPGR